MTSVVIGEGFEGKFTGPVYDSGKLVSLNSITEIDHVGKTLLLHTMNVGVHYLKG